MKMTKAATPRVVRLKFIKVGALQYISHLDLQRTMARALARSGIPVCYTEGFNPQIKLVFAAPLAVGVESVCEFLDIRVTGDISCEEIVRRINAGLADELHVIEAYYPATKFSEIAAADYFYRIITAGAGHELAGRIKKHSSPVMVTESQVGDGRPTLPPDKPARFHIEAELSKWRQAAGRIRSALAQCRLTRCCRAFAAT